MFWWGVVLMVFLLGWIYVGWMIDFDEMQREFYERDDPDW